VGLDCQETVRIGYLGDPFRVRPKSDTDGICGECLALLVNLKDTFAAVTDEDPAGAERGSSGAGTETGETAGANLDDADGPWFVSKAKIAVFEQPERIGAVDHNSTDRAGGTADDSETGVKLSSLQQAKLAVRPAIRADRQRIS